MRALALLTQIGIAVIVPIFGGVWLGNKADQLLGTGGLFLVLGIILGVIVGFRSAYRLIMTQGDNGK